jgi:hypothetical protein
MATWGRFEDAQVSVLPIAPLPRANLRPAVAPPHEGIGLSELLSLLEATEAADDHASVRCIGEGPCGDEAAFIVQAVKVRAVVSDCV